MLIFGLTGSIGMGKTVAASLLRRLGVPVFDADRAVHELLGSGGEAVAAVAAAFPDAVRGEGLDRRIDRSVLGRLVFGDAEALARLEAILHPRVRVRERRFIAVERRRRRRLVVLDIPLLFETEGEQRCDAVIVVSAPFFLQYARVMGRPGMTEMRFRAILAKQMPDAEKRRRADFVVPTGLGRALTLRRLSEILRLSETCFRRPSRRPLRFSPCRHLAIRCAKSFSILKRPD
jgi:dephospho-CoA kinase